MPVPDFQTIMLPMLKIAGDGNAHSTHDFLDTLARHFDLSPEEFNELLPSGKQTRFYNRIVWAKTYLIKSGLLHVTTRPNCSITQRGTEVLRSNPPRIDMNFLQQFPEYMEFRERHTDGGEKKTKKPHPQQPTPEEALELAYEEIRQSLASDLIDSVRACSPKFFEQLVVDLLVKMGYGGSYKEAARAVGQSGDGGIDGIIDEDRLGLDAIYIQAKRWGDQTTVSRPEIQKFAGALMGKKADKGIFITTSSFSKEARQYAETINSKIILIDGERLAELMIDYDIGVTNITSYHLKRIDSDYFGTEG